MTCDYYWEILMWNYDITCDCYCDCWLSVDILWNWGKWDNRIYLINDGMNGI